MVNALIQTVFVQKEIETSIDLKSKLFIWGKPFEQNIKQTPTSCGSGGMNWYWTIVLNAVVHLEVIRQGPPSSLKEKWAFVPSARREQSWNRMQARALQVSLTGEEVHLPPSPQVLGQPDTPHSGHREGLQLGWGGNKAICVPRELKDWPGLGDQKYSFLEGLVCFCSKGWFLLGLNSPNLLKRQRLV